MKLENVIKGSYETVNGVINVFGNVDIASKGLTEIPWKFGVVTGNFYCGDNQLTSLQYCPVSVGGSFYCSGNQLISLKYCPTSVGKCFNCNGNPIESFKGVPFDVLMKINNIQKNYSHLIKTIIIPQEYYEEIEKIVENKLVKKKVSKTISIQERLRNIV